MTQHELLIEYIREHGSITPATLKDSQRAYKGGYIGSEAIRRAQELEPHTKPNLLKYPRLYKHRNGKFTTFTLTPKITAYTIGEVCCYSHSRFGVHSTDCQLKSPKVTPEVINQKALF